VSGIAGGMISAVWNLGMPAPASNRRLENADTKPFWPGLAAGQPGLTAPRLQPPRRGAPSRDPPPRISPDPLEASRAPTPRASSLRRARDAGRAPVARRG